MSAPYYADESVQLFHGDALTVLRDLPDASVDCCVTSPPYFGLRDYGVDGQLGAEASPAEYVENLRAVFAEVRRVLADDGTLWLNLGDSYSSAAGGAPTSGNVQTNGGERYRRPRVQDFIPPKNLIGTPWRTALALQDDGWILRNDIVWAKPNGMPESIRDRLSTKHEHVFLLTKSRRYWFDLDPIRQPTVTTSAAALSWARETKEAEVPGQSSPQHRVDRVPRPGGHGQGRNPGDVWTIPTAPFPGAHFACMPPALAERCILAGCKPGGTVLDPFSGSGTTGLAAAKHGRRYVGIDLNRDYLDLSLRTRLAQPGLDLGEVTA